MLYSQIITGLISGSVYASVAVGIVMIYKATEIINFAQGETFMLGAYFAYLFYSVFHIPYPGGCPLWQTLASGDGNVTQYHVSQSSVMEQAVDVGAHHPSIGVQRAFRLMASSSATPGHVERYPGWLSLRDTHMYLIALYTGAFSA